MRRPVLTVVANLLIVVAGLAAFRGVEIREMPDIDRPVITIRATYEGATPETIDTQVTRHPGRRGVARAGRQVDLLVEPLRHEPHRRRVRRIVDLNVAANDLRDAVGNVERQLPDDVEDVTIVKADDNSDAIMRLAVTAETCRSRS